MKNEKSLLPKVSIVTVCFNSAQTIEDTINSVINQTYSNIEYIIVDGGSTDGTLEILEKYKSKISLILSEPDQGLYDAMNKGVFLSTGEVVGILNSDDFYSSNQSISKIIGCLVESGCDSIFADLVYVSFDKGKELRYYKSGPWSPWMFRFGKMPAHPTFFTFKRVYEKTGRFSLDYRIAADFELLVRMLARDRISFTYLPEVVIKMRAGGVSTLGFKSIYTLNTEIVKACRKNGIKTYFIFLLLKLPFKLLEVSVSRLGLRRKSKDVI